MIRKLDNKDIDRVMKIWFETTIKAHSFIEKSYWEQMFDVVKNQYIPISETFVFEKNGEIQGFISLIENKHIGALFVSEKFQGQRIGTHLIEYVFKIVNDLTLDVYKENNQAVQFYKRMGFEIKSESLNSDTNQLEYCMKKANK